MTSVQKVWRAVQKRTRTVVQKQQIYNRNCDRLRIKNLNSIVHSFDIELEDDYLDKIQLIIDPSMYFKQIPQGYLNALHYLNMNRPNLLPIIARRLILSFLLVPNGVTVKDVSQPQYRSSFIVPQEFVQENPSVQRMTEGKIYSFANVDDYAVKKTCQFNQFLEINNPYMLRSVVNRYGQEHEEKIKKYKYVFFLAQKLTLEYKKAQIIGTRRSNSQPDIIMQLQQRIIEPLKLHVQQLEELESFFEDLATKPVMVLQNQSPGEIYNIGIYIFIHCAQTVNQTYSVGRSIHSDIQINDMKISKLSFFPFNRTHAIISIKVFENQECFWITDRFQNKRRRSRTYLYMKKQQEYLFQEKDKIQIGQHEISIELVDNSQKDQKKDTTQFCRSRYLLNLT